ncbi:MAG: hypothetical protein COA84_13215 [Robiginitomaculum sp.]|nr:MAG: hypothetical protein COA84_13215 [Robiginitomaculum sp.]
MNNSIGDALNIKPVDEPTVNVLDTIAKSDIAIIPEETESVKDLSKVRANIIKVMESGAEAMEEMLGLANAAQDPKMFDSVATLMVATLRANRDLMDLHRVRERNASAKSGKPVKDNDDRPHVTNNIMVSPDELIEKYMKQKDDVKGDIIDHE